MNELHPERDDAMIILGDKPDPSCLLCKGQGVVTHKFVCVCYGIVTPARLKRFRDEVSCCMAHTTETGRVRSDQPNPSSLSDFNRWRFSAEMLNILRLSIPRAINDISIEKLFNPYTGEYTYKVDNVVYAPKGIEALAFEALCTLRNMNKLIQGRNTSEIVRGVSITPIPLMQGLDPDYEQMEKSIENIMSKGINAIGAPIVFGTPKSSESPLEHMWRRSQRQVSERGIPPKYQSPPALNLPLPGNQKLSLDELKLYMSRMLEANWQVQFAVSITDPTDVQVKGENLQIPRIVNGEYKESALPVFRSLQSQNPRSIPAPPVIFDEIVLGEPEFCNLTQFDLKKEFDAFSKEKLSRLKAYYDSNHTVSDNAKMEIPPLEKAEEIDTPLLAPTYSPNIVPYPGKYRVLGVDPGGTEIHTAAVVSVTNGQMKVEQVLQKIVKEPEEECDKPTEVPVR